MYRKLILVVALGAMAIVGASACTPQPTYDELLVTGRCYDSSTPGTLDFTYNGPRNTRPNVTIHQSTDGSCTNTGGPATVVEGASNGAAVAACDTAFGVTGSVAVSLTSLGYAVSPSLWIC